MIATRDIAMDVAQRFRASDIMSEESVDENEVVRYFLKCEIGKVVCEWKQTEDFMKSFDQAIGSLNEKEARRLAIALSCHYRNNPLCKRWSLLRWRLRNIPCRQFFVSKINDRVNPTLEKYRFNLAEFVQYLRTDGVRDENLKEFRDDGRRIWHARLIAEEVVGGVQILDGSHRAVIIALRGNSEMSCYVGYKLGCRKIHT